jgi:hypothetical protein
LRFGAVTWLLAFRPLPARVGWAFAFLVHFVGDIHQCTPATDRAAAAYNHLWRHTGYNLHSVWDGLLADRAISATSIVRAFSAAGVVEQEMRKAQAKVDDIAGWPLYPQRNVDGDPWFKTKLRR